jgi:hypothetical protein
MGRHEPARKMLAAWAIAAAVIIAALVILA